MGITDDEMLKLARQNRSISREELGIKYPSEEGFNILPEGILYGDTAIGKEKQKEYDTHDSAVIILRKYQKIQEIMNELNGNFYGSYLKDRQTLEKIWEVIDNGNIDCIPNIER